jgi:hypothetical protein
MDELKESRRRAGDSLPPQDVSYERLMARRERKRRNSRLGSAIVAVVVVAGAIGGVVAALNVHGSQAPDKQGKKPVAGGGPDLQAGPGQYYYWKTIRARGRCRRGAVVGGGRLWEVPGRLDQPAVRGGG